MGSSNAVISSGISRTAVSLKCWAQAFTIQCCARPPSDWEEHLGRWLALAGTCSADELSGLLAAEMGFCME